MTANELRKYLEDVYALGRWPLSLEVDAQTYANVCMFIFQNADAIRQYDRNLRELRHIRITVGSHGGIFFKDVEIVCKEETS